MWSKTAAVLKVRSLARPRGASWFRKPSLTHLATPAARRLAARPLALKRELPAYLTKCAGTAFDHTDVAKFTKDVLLWWANNGKEFPTWALAVQIVGSLTPNSAAAERVFSMLKLMFGDMQMTALMDMIQAALMLKYNNRKVG
jgi:hypothetical protein